MKILFSILFILLPIVTQAHQSSTALLSFKDSEQGIQGNLHWRLYDLEQIIGLDNNRDGNLYWNEVESKSQEIITYAQKNISLSQGGNACSAAWDKDFYFNDQSKADAGIVIPVTFDCNAQGSASQSSASQNSDSQNSSAENLSSQDTYEIFYSGMFQALPDHRLLWSFEQDGQSMQGVLAQAGTVTLDDRLGFWQTFSEFFIQGIIHIGLGLDHVAFLLTLLLVSVLVNDQGRWKPAQNIASCLRSAAILVTTFTIAHSLTLGASVMDWLTLPGYWVEMIIAFSVVVAALNNIRSFLPSTVVMVFVFGLIHGFGFSGVLSELTIHGENKIISLLGFNLGVEFGQILITLCVLPILISMRNFAWYPTFFVRSISSFIAACGGFWLLSRI